MKKELLTVGIAATATMSALAHHHGGWGHHGWGRGGCHFWPGFAGGVVGGWLGGLGWGHRTVVVPAYTTYAAPVVVSTSVAPQSTVVQPVQANTTVQTTTLPANNTVVSTKEPETTVYVDTNGNQRVEGKLLIDAKGNKMLPASYRVIRVNDLTRE